MEPLSRCNNKMAAYFVKYCTEFTKTFFTFKTSYDTKTQA